MWPFRVHRPTMDWVAWSPVNHPQVVVYPWLFPTAGWFKKGIAMTQVMTRISKLYSVVVGMLVSAERILNAKKHCLWMKTSQASWRSWCPFWKQSSHQTDFVFASIATINQRGSVVAQNRTTFEGTYYQFYLTTMLMLLPKAEKQIVTFCWRRS